MTNLFKVDGQTLTPIEIYPAVSDTVNYLTFAFMFSYDWDVLVKSAIFTKGASEYEVVLVNDAITADRHVNLSAGDWTLSVVGSTVVDAVVTKQITTTPYTFTVSQSDAVDGEEFPPSIASQVYVNVNQATPQTFVGGIPKLAADRVISDNNDLVDKKHVDDVVATVTADDFNHNDLSNIQGGSAGEYYHTTQAQNAALHAHANKAALDAVSGTNTGDQNAAGVANTPAGNIAATTVQAAINELDAAIAPVTSQLAEIASDVRRIDTALETDKTLTVSGAAADAKATGDAIDFTRLKMVLTKSDNLIDVDAVTSGYVGTNGVVGSGSYFYTAPIAVVAGDVLSFWRGNQASGLSDSYYAIDVRFICAYDTNGAVVSASGSSVNVQTFTIPAGITSIVLSIAASYFAYDLMVVKGTLTPTQHIAYYAPHYISAHDFMPLTYRRGKGYERVAAATLESGSVLYLPGTNIVKNIEYAFYAKVSSFSSINIGQGTSDKAYHTYVTIGTSNIIWVINGTQYTYAHSLTIADYIRVRIKVNSNTAATLTIDTTGGTYTKTLGWYGFADAKYLVSNSGSGLTECVFTVSFRDIVGADAYIFGDSYIAIIESTSKWTNYLVADGYGDNALINARPGEAGASAMSDLYNILQLGVPKFLFWALGMNDGADADASTPNATWLAAVNIVLGWCVTRGITPILSTIPTVPSILHEGKNAWIRASGYRYVDFAKAVGAQADGTWFTGLIASDNAHPSILGAKALYHRVLCDFPEITM